MRDDVQRIHSGAYHKYFEGFAEIQYYDQKDKLHTDRIYVGRRYRREVSDKVNVIIKISYLLLYLVAAVLWILAGVRDTDSDTEWFVMIPSALSLIMMLWLIFPLFYNITAKREMIIRNYRDSHEGLYRIAYITAALQFLNTVVSAVCGEMFCSVMYLISALLLTAIAFCESHIQYEVILSDKKAPSGYTIIQYRSYF